MTQSKDQSLFIIVADSLLRFRYRNKLMNLLVIKDDYVIEADSLVNLLIKEINFELVIVADSLVAHERVDRLIHS